MGKREGKVVVGRTEGVRSVRCSASKEGRARWGLGADRATRGRGKEEKSVVASVREEDLGPRHAFDLSGGKGGLGVGTALLAAGSVGAAVYAGSKLLNFTSGSRPYDENVGNEYDSWTNDGVLEYYWGEHIHLGYYSDAELEKGWKKKDFKEAKYDFIEEMLKWSGAVDSGAEPKNILDVGCGIGGTSRYLARKFPNARVTGITISEAQVKRATELAKEQGLANVEFKLVDALNMSFEDDQFDLVWGCESGEHMPDKRRYVEEMTRVLAPGGNLAIATWCQRHSTEATPFTDKEKDDLQFLYDEWAHPYFISIKDYEGILKGTTCFSDVSTDDWTKPTIASWRHSIWVGVVDPWIVVFKGPVVWYKTVREIVTLERMHQAFDSGLMEYGMIKGTKKASGEAAASASVGSQSEASAGRPLTDAWYSW
ncbi:S-adenosyl-L-methionine-dependent methyltransferase [Chloropicon primus]|uniref:S-adenosyl-L-methionine-dependent methyltransferase n=2 Tax=Chloropicon primus TaxID=1764295 RepID=A0A5B8MCD1_9CHLO|nr:S-adenosyl-L-methionine-dependent methyltransferase [Chloropicon primus]|eukprot:QDZ18136.1 S-adenosyl-L-methionine-dependent methyltransferase [Chloropicon primus]